QGVRKPFHDKSKPNSKREATFRACNLVRNTLNRLSKPTSLFYEKITLPSISCVPALAYSDQRVGAAANGFERRSRSTRFRKRSEYRHRQRQCSASQRRAKPPRGCGHLQHRDRADVREGERGFHQSGSNLERRNPAI